MSTKLMEANVSKNYGESKVLKNVEIILNKGEIYGLLGPSGSGKTTLVKLLCGIEDPSEGKVSVFNQQMPDLNIMKRIGYMAQADALYHELTAKENLEFFASIYGIKRTKQKEQIQHVMKLVDLERDLKKKVEEFSGGMKRRLSLAIALLHEPEILVLDEPTVGIDPALRNKIWETFEHLRQNGVLILVTTHVMDEAERCTKLGMIRNGKLIASGTPDELKHEIGATTIEQAFLSYGGE